MAPDGGERDVLEVSLEDHLPAAQRRSETAQYKPRDPQACARAAACTIQRLTIVHRVHRLPCLYLQRVQLAEHQSAQHAAAVLGLQHAPCHWLTLVHCVQRLPCLDLQHTCSWQSSRRQPAQHAAALGQCAQSLRAPARAPALDDVRVLRVLVRICCTQRWLGQVKALAQHAGTAKGRCGNMSHSSAAGKPAHRGV